MSTMTSVRTNGVELGVETFGRDADPLVLLAGGTTMLSWPDSVCERLAAGGPWVARDGPAGCGASATLAPEAPASPLPAPPPLSRGPVAPPPPPPTSPRAPRARASAGMAATPV